MQEYTYFKISCRHCGTVNHISPDNVIANLNEANCNHCSRNLFLYKNERYIDLSPKAYEHPLDKKALDYLRTIPGLEDVMKNILKHISDRYFQIFFLQNYVKVTENHIPSLYSKLKKVTEILDLAYVPEFYIVQNPTPNAFVMGIDKAFIGITTEALDLLDDDEIEGVLAHEVAHIKSNHILYKTLVYILSNIALLISSTTLGLGNLLTLPVMYALKYWDRCSELSADRAEILVTRDYEKFVKTHMKLRSGLMLSKAYKDEFDIKEFEKQAEEVAALGEENLSDKILMFIQELGQTHPFTVWRVGALKKWFYEEDFYKILAGDYIKRDSALEESMQKEEQNEQSQNTENKDFFEGMVNDFKNFFGI